MPRTRHVLSSWTIGAALWFASTSVVGAGVAERGSGPPAQRDRSAAAAPADKDRDLLQDALPCLRSILERSLYGASDREVAAWLVESRQGGGKLDCLDWPPTEADGEARWSGPLPLGLLAQVHSHPTRAISGRMWSPRPSWRDCLTARRLKVPVITISVAGVYECRPADGHIVLRLGPTWVRRPSR